MIATIIPPTASSERTLRIVGALGALLALVILGASILLRLTSVMGADDVVRSSLTADSETWLRLAHRLAAAGVGVLALLASGLGWMRRNSIPRAVTPIFWLVGATVLLAVVGPLTPGYRYSMVTVTNVVTGTVLLAACWWLRETLTSSCAQRHSLSDPMLRLTFWILAVHVGLGAAASALEMRGTHWMALVHSGSAMLTTLMVASVLWDRRTNPSLTFLVGFLWALLALQVVLGVVALGMEGRPVLLGFVHAMLSPLLIGGLVSLALRGSVPPSR